jgi:hypothetical protein
VLLIATACKNASANAGRVFYRENGRAILLLSGGAGKMRVGVFRALFGEMAGFIEKLWELFPDWI